MSLESVTSDNINRPDKTSISAGTIANIADKVCQLVEPSLEPEVTNALAEGRRGSPITDTIYNFLITNASSSGMSPQKLANTVKEAMANLSPQQIISGIGYPEQGIEELRSQCNATNQIITNKTPGWER